MTNDCEMQLMQLISDLQQTDAPRIETIYAALNSVINAMGRYIQNEKEFQKRAIEIMNTVEN